MVKNNVVLQTGEHMHVWSALQILHDQLLPITHAWQQAAIREWKTRQSDHGCPLAPLHKIVISTKQGEVYTEANFIFFNIFLGTLHFLQDQA